ncbi:hypothetical protein TNCV_2448661 [Trichonephila clavipes]|uniref:Uncharacterized protein n=1 Tax=Trichonephila clavipes TaxID=2585209 RepID=A0A8X6SK31_TRICX|nr:hypothetical protein TNCV_2448661 [Trichonephila clavipes]
MFKGAKEEDLRRIASELELCVSDKLTVLDFMDLIKNYDLYKKTLIADFRMTKKERETEESSMSQLSAKASVFKPINYIGDISKEESSSQGVGDLFTATSYVKSKSVLLSTVICFIRDSFGKNAGGQSAVRRWFNKQFYFATVYE